MDFKLTNDFDPNEKDELMLKWKKEAGEIPNLTCYEIDKMIELLNQLREENKALRSLGIFWYRKCQELLNIKK